MAEKKSERIVIIPLRAGWLKKPRDDRTKRAITDIRNYVFRHTDAEEVKVSKLVNETIWKRGKQKPQGKIKVKVTVMDGKATVRLPDEREETKEEKKSAAASLKERIIGKKAEAKSDGAAKEKHAEAKEKIPFKEKPPDPEGSTDSASSKEPQKIETTADKKK